MAACTVASTAAFPRCAACVRHFVLPFQCPRTPCFAGAVVLCARAVGANSCTLLIGSSTMGSKRGGIQGLLQGAWRRKDGDRGRDQEGVPQAGTQIPPRREQGTGRGQAHQGPE